MPTGDLILSATGLRKKFTIDKSSAGAIEVLKGVDLSVAKGEFVAIVGASGSGKSTLLHILGGLDHPTEGEVRWSGESIFSWSDARLSAARGKEVGFVFQFHHLLPEFSAEENVMIPQMIAGTAMGEAKRRAGELLRSVGLEERARHRPVELSGGEQQRVAIARALANTPSILFADEPSGNLDSEGSAKLHDLLRDLNKTASQTFIVVTHNADFARNADTVYRMEDGILRKERG